MKGIKIKQTTVGLILLLTGLLLGRLIFGSSDPQTKEVHQHETTEELWTCAMHPQVSNPGPGQCPICGMDLTPVTIGSLEKLDQNQVQMTEAAMKLADVQTVIVGRTIPEKQVYLPGKIEADERGIANVTAHFSGRVEQLFADFTGQYINRGQKLATLYSPDLVTAQKELFEALKFKTSNPSFYEAAVQKLKLWELTDYQINSIIEVGEPQYYFNVYAPRSGTILGRKISEGEHVMDGQVLFEIADLNRLWVLFDAFESDIPWIKVGDSISFKVQSLPGKTFKSLVTFIDPVVNNQTRTASVRTEIVNINNQLKPEMFVEGIVTAGLTTNEESISIPKTAVLWTGKRAVVYVKQSGFTQPTCEFRELELGADAGEYYLVNGGLMAGEEIVTNGVFKIDGAAQLQGRRSMMNPGGGRSSADHRHQDAHLSTNNNGSTLTTHEVPTHFKDAIQGVYRAYLPFAEALVMSDLPKAKRLARKVFASVNAVDGNLDDPASAQWKKDYEVFSNALQSIDGASSLDEVRKALPLLSDQLYESIKHFQVQTGGYRAYCPMAFDMHGAFWLSGSKEIRNPYFGDRMLSCGSVEESL